MNAEHLLRRVDELEAKLAPLREHDELVGMEYHVACELTDELNDCYAALRELAQRAR